MVLNICTSPDRTFAICITRRAIIPCNNYIVNSSDSSNGFSDPTIFDRNLNSTSLAFRSVKSIRTFAPDSLVPDIQSAIVNPSAFIRDRPIQLASAYRSTKTAAVESAADFHARRFSCLLTLRGTQTGVPSFLKDRIQHGMSSCNKRMPQAANSSRGPSTNIRCEDGTLLFGVFAVRIRSPPLPPCPYSSIARRISRFIYNVASLFFPPVCFTLLCPPRSRLYPGVPLLARWQTAHRYTRTRAHVRATPGTYQAASLLVPFSPSPLLVTPLLIANMPIIVIYKPRSALARFLPRSSRSEFPCNRRIVRSRLPPPPRRRSVTAAHNLRFFLAVPLLFSPARSSFHRDVPATLRRRGERGQAEKSRLNWRPNIGAGSSLQSRLHCTI